MSVENEWPKRWIFFGDLGDYAPASRNEPIGYFALVTDKKDLTSCTKSAKAGSSLRRI